MLLPSLMGGRVARPYLPSDPTADGLTDDEKKDAEERRKRDAALGAGVVGTEVELTPVPQLPVRRAVLGAYDPADREGFRSAIGAAREAGGVYVPDYALPAPEDHFDAYERAMEGPRRAWMEAQRQARQGEVDAALEEARRKQRLHLLSTTGVDLARMVTGARIDRPDYTPEVLASRDRADQLRAEAAKADALAGPESEYAKAARWVQAQRDLARRTEEWSGRQATIDQATAQTVGEFDRTADETEAKNQGLRREGEVQAIGLAADRRAEEAARRKEEFERQDALWRRSIQERQLAAQEAHRAWQRSQAERPAGSGYVGPSVDVIDREITALQYALDNAPKDEYGNGPSPSDIASVREDILKLEQMRAEAVAGGSRPAPTQGAVMEGTGPLMGARGAAGIEATVRALPTPQMKARYLRSEVAGGRISQDRAEAIARSILGR